MLTIFNLNSFPIFKYRKDIVSFSKNILPKDGSIFNQYLNEQSVFKFLIINYKIRKKFKSFKKKRIYKNYYYKLIRSKLSRGGKLALNNYLFSFVGVDGSGKTTTIDKVNSLLSTQLKTKVVYFGIPKSIKEVKLIFFKLKKFFKKTESNIDVTEINKTYKNKNRLIDSLFSILVSFIKFSKYLKVKIYHSRGYIVLTDRYPVEDIVDDLPQWKNSYFKNYEEKLNKVFSEPSKIFLLHADEEILQNRKPESYQDSKKNKLNIQVRLLNELPAKINSVLKIDSSETNKNNEFKIIKEILEMIANDN